MRKLLVLLVMVLPVSAAFGQSTLSNEKDIFDLEARFLEAFLAEQFQDAFDLFRGELSGIPLSDVDTLEAGTARQLTSLRNRYGAAIDSVFLNSEAIEGALLQHVYLVRYQHHALRLRFIYYNNGSIWRLNYFSWDDSVDALFPW